MEMSDKPDFSYFGLQAYVGTTKHMGGLDTTKRLLAACSIDADAYVLEVGCGAGATASYLAREYGCRVMGVDLRESMVALARERAEREGVQDQTEFRVANALSLPFGDGQFDVAVCESVATFIADKARVVREVARVVRPGGTVGLNEEVWLQAPPAGVVDYVRRTWEIEAETPTTEGWAAMLEGAGLEVTGQTFRFDARRESTQMRRYRPRDIFRMVYRALALYVRSGEFRRYMKGRQHMPKGLFEYWGYVLLVGRKPSTGGVS
jgi:arsenite methyltransferase